MKIILITLLLISFIYANPMLKSKQIKPTTEKRLINITFMSPVIRSVSGMQYKLKKNIAYISRQIRKGKSFTGLFMIFTLVFFYGVVHAIGPGHGKIIAITYFLSDRFHPVKGIVFGFIFSLVHSLSALVVYLILNFFSKVIFSSSRNIELIMQKISFGLVFMIGLYMFIQAFRDMKSKEDKGSHRHIHGQSLPLAIGIIPCPGTLLFLSFFYSMGLFWMGIISVFLIAIGMGISLATIAVLVIIFRDKMLTVFNKQNSGKLSLLIKMFGAIVLMALSWVMFLILR